MRASVKNTVNASSREFFQVFLVTYLLLTLAETFREGLVSNFFNMNWLLLAVLVSGVSMVLSEQEQKKVRFHKLAAKGVIVLTSRQERREMIKRQREAMAARQALLRQRRAVDINAISARLPRQIQPKRKPINTNIQKRRMDGFF